MLLGLRFTHFMKNLDVFLALSVLLVKYTVVLSTIQYEKNAPAY